MELWEASTSVSDFYAPSLLGRSWQKPLPKRRRLVAEISGASAQWLLPCLSTLEGSMASADASLCRCLRQLAQPYAARGFHPSATGKLFAAVAWRVGPRLRSYLEAPWSTRLPLAVMNLVAHLVTGACISRPPPALCQESGTTEPSGDLFHVVTTQDTILDTILAQKNHPKEATSGFDFMEQKPQKTTIWL
eukprot:g17046.t1